ncbi:MAG: hypothetical protein ACK5Z2_12030 [Bacteroidota bacterium]
MLKQLLTAGGLLFALTSAATITKDTIPETSKSTEPNWKVEIWGGYMLPIGQQVLGTNMWTTVGYGTTENHYGSLGKGWQAGFTLSRKVAEHYSAELGIGYFTSKTYPIEYEWTDNGMWINGPAKSTMQLRALRVFAGIAVPFYETPKFSLSVRTGAVMAIPKMREDFIFLQYNGDTSGYQTNITHSRIAPGFYAALRASQQLGKHWYINAEILGIAQSWAPGKRTVTRFELYGENKLSQLDVWSKEVVYTKDVPAQQSNVNEPYKVFRIDHTLSSIGLQIGIARSF